MKKISIVASLLFLGSSVFGQLENKNGVRILPQSGDYALGVNAVPFLSYIGNIFNGNTNNTYAGQNKFVNFFSGQSIYGKYFLDDKKAIRANFFVGGRDFNNTNLVFDANGTSPDDEVEDKFSSSFSSYQLGGGLEWRKGENRLQGYYGAELRLGIATGTTRKYNYGNEMTALNPSPEASSWSAGGSVISESPEAERITEFNSSNVFSVGARPFVGVEYFFAPKISLGLEFGWGLVYSSTGKVTNTMESFNTTSGESEFEKEVTSEGSNSFTVGTDNFNGSLNLMFHF